MNTDNVVDCNARWELHTTCFTADPVLSIIGRGCIRGSMLFSGMFEFNYGLKYRYSLRQIYCSFDYCCMFPHKYRTFIG